MEFIGFDNDPKKEVIETYDSKMESSKLEPYKFQGFEDNPLSGRSEITFAGGVGGLGESKFDEGVLLEQLPQLQSIRGENQPWYDQAGSFLNQAVIGEIVGGTIMSAGAMIELLNPEFYKSAIDKSEYDFSNALYDVGESITDWTKDITPIYQTGERFGDSGWWFSNGVSVASTLSMMIPGMGVAKGVGALGKLLKLSTTATKLAATGLGALTMRHAENFREANDVFESVYTLGMQNNKGEEASRKAASDAASLDYQANYANLAFDLIQMSAILRPFAGLTRNVGVVGKIASSADELLAVSKYTPASKLGKILNRIKDPAKIGLAEWTEGIEEGINTASQFEATRQGRIDLGLQTDDGSDLMGRVKDYLGTEEMQDSMMWGMLGGMAFKGVAGAMGFDENAATTKRKLSELASRSAKINHYGKVINAINKGIAFTSPTGEVIQDFSKVPVDERPGMIADIKEKMLQDLTFNAAKAGNVDILIEQLKDSKFADTLSQLGVDSKESIAKEIPNLIKKVEQYESVYAKHFTNLFESPIDSRAKSTIVENLASLEAEVYRNNEVIKQFDKVTNELLSKDAWYQSQDNKLDVDATIENYSLLYAKNALEKSLEERGITPTKLSIAEKALANINKRIASSKAISKPVDITAIDQRVVSNVTEKIITEEFNKELAKEITELSKPASVKKQAETIVKDLKKVQDTVKENKAAADNAKVTTERKGAKAIVNEAVEPTVETGNESSLEDFGVVEETTTPIETSTEETIPTELPFDDTSLEKLLEETTTKSLPTETTSDKIDNAETKLRKDWQRDLDNLYQPLDDTLMAKGTELFRRTNSEEEFNTGERFTSVGSIEAFSFNPDGKTLKGVKIGGQWYNKGGWNRFFIKGNEDEINAYYSDLLAKLPTPDQTSQGTIENVIEESTFEDGNNIEVDSKVIEVEESSQLINKDNLKRNQGLAINYLTSDFKVSGENLAKETVDITKSNSDALVASEWTEFIPGTKVVLSLDTQFKGEVYQYVGEDKTARVLSEGKPVTYQRSFEEILAEDKLNVPIKIQVERDGNLVTVGYLPTMGWLQSVDTNGAYENLSDSDVFPASNEIETVRKIRETISNGQLDATYDFTISDKGLGKLAITTDRDSNKKKVLKPVSEIMPNYISSKFFSGVIQPFTIFNKGFLVSNNTEFGGQIAVSEDTMEMLKAVGTGSVMMMIPTAKAGVFIPTPVAVPLVPSNVATAMTDVISAVAFNDNPALLEKIRYNYGINIASRKELKEFLDKFIYFSSVDKVNKTTGDGRVRIAFDTQNSTFLVNNGDGKAVYKVALNIAGTRPEELEASINKLKASLLNSKMSVKLNQINSTESFSVPVIAENSDVNFEESTYNKFLADNIQTDLVELISAKGNPVYVVQPVVTLQEAPTIEKPETTVTIEEEIIDLPEGFGQDFMDLDISDELIGVSDVKDGFTRFYRGETSIKTDFSKLPNWIESNAGNWWSIRESKAIEFAKYRESPKVFYLDIPSHIIYQFRGDELSGTTEDEYLIPKAIQEMYGKKEFFPMSDELISPSQVEEIKSFATNFLVKDGEYVYSSENQRIITQTIASEVYSQFLDYDNQGKKLPVNLAFANARKVLQGRYTNTLEVLFKLGKDKAEKIIADPKHGMGWVGNYENLLKVKEDYERLLKPEIWNQFEREVVNDLKNLSIDIKNGTAEDVNTTETKEVSEAVEEGTLEGNEGQFEKGYNDFATFQMDSKDTASWRVKLALSTIKNGNRNFLGTAEFLPFDTVFDDLQNILSGVDGDIEVYLSVLNQVATDNKTKSYIKSIVNLLTNSTTSWALKNNFISVMQRAHNEFLLTKWKRGINGWTLNVIDSNRNNVVNKILESWNENFKVSGLEDGIITSKGGELIVNQTKAKELLEEVKKLGKEGTLEQKKEFAERLFTILGIDLPETARKAIFDNKPLQDLGIYSYGVKGGLDQQFRFTAEDKSDGLIAHIVSSLASDTSTTNVDEDVDKLSLNNPFTGENSERAVKFLANLSAKYGLKLDTNTHRSVNGKQIYDYSFYTPERLRIQNINNSKGLREDLGNAVFSNSEFSRYLRRINAGKTLDYYFVDGLSQVQSSKAGVTRSDMSSKEQMLLALSHFQKSGLNAGYIGLTHSDKSVTPVIEFEKIKVALGLEKFDGVVTSEMLKTKDTVGAIRELIEAESARIKKIRAIKKQGDEAKANLRREVGDQYYSGAEFFYFFPGLNKIVRDGDGNVVEEILDNVQLLVDTVFESTIVPTINHTVQEFFDTGIIYEGKDKGGNPNGKWYTAFREGYVKENGYGRNSGEEGLSLNEVTKLAAIAAADIDINYIIHNANMIMLVHGDPALEFKNDVKTTWIEYQKRLAKDVAPGALGHYKWSMVSGDNTYSGSPVYNVAFLADVTNPTETEGYIARVNSPYLGKIDRTDAQEWTTVKEHLNVLMSYGRIPDAMYKSMMDKITSAKNFDYQFSEEELAVVLQPMKPVHVMSIFDSKLGIEKSYYIKSSSYPLIPQLTQGLDLDKIRVAMERDGVDRAAFKTSTKIGFKKLVTISDGNGNLLDNLSFKDATTQLSREGFSIQQDVPYEEGKHRIVTISQMNKLLFEGIADLTFNFNGETLTGLQLKKRKELVRSKLFELSASELYSRMGIKVIDGIPVIKNKQRLMESVKEEAVSRGWSINDIESLAVDENGNFIVPLSFNNSASRIESLILSMFTNTIIKQKINGKSMVQGTSAGFKNNVKTLEEIKDQSGIVFVKDKFNPAKGLQYLTINGEKVSKAQVLIPWKFAGDIKNFVDKDGYLDLSKIDPELLNLIGARIPNQGHSSQLAIEVVGFLPHNMGDLIIVPGEITKQMGSDFDVDKLYTYIYNNVIDKSGNLVKVPQSLMSTDGEINKSSVESWMDDVFGNAKLAEYKVGKDAIARPSYNEVVRMIYENAYINIHNVVLTHEEVVKKCLKELDQKDLELTGKVGDTGTGVGNYLTFRRQLSDYSKQKAGKDGVGVFSRAVVGASVIQDYNLRLSQLDEKRNVVDKPFRGFSVGNEVLSLVRLSGTGKSSFDGNERSKVSNLIIQQSGAVDNAKTPVLSMNNLNMTTFNVSIAISLLQTDGGKALDLSYNSYFLKQEILMDYVREMESISDTLNEDYVSDRKEEVINRLKEKYITRAGIKTYTTIGESFTSDAMKSLLTTKDKNTPDYVKSQLEILEHFLTLDEIGKELSEIFGAISVDSKGLGKSYWESSLKEEQINNIAKKSIITGAGELMVDSENGKIAQYVSEANKVMRQLFPYTKPEIIGTIKEIERITGREERVSADFRQDIWNDFRRFISSNSQLDVTGDRQELFYGDNSMAKQVDVAKQGWGKNNLFVLKLRSAKATKEGNPNLVVFAASLAERTDEADVIKAFTDILISNDPEIRQFGENLIKYAYMSGGVQQALEYLKYIPTAYLRTTNFTSIIDGVLANFENADRFIEQFLQHNPNYVKKVPFEPNKKSFELDTEKHFSLLENVKTPDGVVKQFPKYLVYRGDKKWQLYKKIDHNTYSRISTLGGKGKDLTSYNEFDYNSDNVVSSMPSNRQDLAIEQPVEMVVTPIIATDEPTVPNPIATEVKASIYVSKDVQGVEAVKYLVDRLTTDRFKALGKILLSNSNHLREGLKITVDNNLKSSKTGNPSRGKYVDGVASINPSKVAEFEELMSRKPSATSYEAALMHELLHGYTSEAYDAYKRGDKVSPAMAESFRKIEGLLNVATSKLSPGDLNKVNAIILAQKTGDKSLIGATTEEQAEVIEQFYGFTSPKEFISEAMSNSVFQAKLNEMQFDSKRTIMQRFLDLIKGLFEGIKSDSVLESTFAEVIELLENQSNPVVEQTTITPAYTYETEQDAALYVGYKNIPTGTIIQINEPAYNGLFKVINPINGDIDFIKISDNKITPKDFDFTGGIPTGESMFVGVSSLGTTVGEFMKNLTKEEKSILRGLINNKEIIFNCR